MEVFPKAQVPRKIVQVTVQLKFINFPVEGQNVRPFDSSLSSDSRSGTSDKLTTLDPGCAELSGLVSLSEHPPPGSPKGSEHPPPASLNGSMVGYSGMRTLSLCIFLIFCFIISSSFRDSYSFSSNLSVLDMSLLLSREFSNRSASNVLLSLCPIISCRDASSRILFHCAASFALSVVIAGVNPRRSPFGILRADA